jgi:rRNA maturation endonuclease Nob1
VSETEQPSTSGQSAQPQHELHAGQTPRAKIHRVCIGCNNMFEVTIENYEVKHCPTCRKE